MGCNGATSFYPYAVGCFYQWKHILEMFRGLSLILGAVVVVIIGFTTTCAISAYHHWCCEFESRSGQQHYVCQRLATGQWYIMSMFIKKFKEWHFLGCSPPAANDLYFMPPPIKHKFSKNSLAFGNLRSVYMMSF